MAVYPDLNVHVLMITGKTCSRVPLKGVVAVWPQCLVPLGRCCTLMFVYMRCGIIEEQVKVDIRYFSVPAVVCYAMIWALFYVSI